jgi:hypothetical protein
MSIWTHVRRARFGVAILLVLAVAAGWAGRATFANFTSKKSNSATFSSQRVFPGTRTTSAWSELDAASGTGADQSDLTSFVDGRTATSGNFAFTFSSSNYFDQSFIGSLPAGVTVTGATANLNIAASRSSDTACFYVETRSRSTGTPLATHGSSTSPAGCVTGTTVIAFTVSLPEVTTTDIANDLAVKLYVKNSGSKAISIDRDTVTVTTPVGSFTLYETSATYSPGGTPFSFPWSLATAGDGTVLTTAAWATTFSGTRYERFTFPSDHVPSGASVTNATLTVAYKSAGAGKSTCVWYEVYSGATVIGTHGSSTTAFSCSPTTGAWQTDTVSLPEVNTAAGADGLIVRMYGKDTGPSASQIDNVALAVGYSVN